MWVYQPHTLCWGCWIWRTRSRNISIRGGGYGHCCLSPRSCPYLVAGAEFSPISWERQHAHRQVHEAADLQVHIAPAWSLGSGHSIPTPDHVAVAALHTRSQKEDTESAPGQFAITTQEWNAPETSNEAFQAALIIFPSNKLIQLQPSFPQTQTTQFRYGNLSGYFSLKSTVFRWLLPSSMSIPLSGTDNEDGGIPTLEMANGGTKGMVTISRLK